VTDQPGAGRLPHPRVQIGPVSVVEVVAEQREELAATTSHIEGLLTLSRKVSQNPAMKVVIVAPRVALVEPVQPGSHGRQPLVGKLPGIHDAKLRGRTPRPRLLRPVGRLRHQP